MIALETVDDIKNRSMLSMREASRVAQKWERVFNMSRARLNQKHHIQFSCVEAGLGGYKSSLSSDDYHLYLILLTLQVIKTQDRQTNEIARSAWNKITVDSNMSVRTRL